MGIKVREAQSPERGRNVQAMTTTDRTATRRRKESSNTSIYHPVLRTGVTFVYGLGSEEELGAIFQRHGDQW